MMEYLGTNDPSWERQEMRHLYSGHLHLELFSGNAGDLYVAADRGAEPVGWFRIDADTWDDLVDTADETYPPACYWTEH